MKELLCKWPPRSISYWILTITLLALPAYGVDKIEITEKQIVDANRTEANYNKSNMFVRDAALDSYLGKILKRITTQLPESETTKFRIHALVNSLPYIYILDNSAIYVSTGLLARLQNESQLAGLLAVDLSAFVQQNTQNSNAFMAKKMPLNLFLVVATGGIAALPVMSKEESDKKKFESEARLASDKLAYQWLQAGGFDIAEPARAIKRLLDTLTAEDRFGEPELAKRLTLEDRLRGLNKALPETLPTPPTTDAKEFNFFARRFAFVIAESDRNTSNSERFFTVLDRTESELGANGKSTFLRAEYTRESILDDSRLPEAIVLYERCVNFADAPIEAYRELGLLHRQNNNKTSARRNFETYLQKQPNAVDAPIIHSYMESL